MRPILNSAKDPFAEGVMTDADRYTCTIVKNVVSYNPVGMRPYQNSVNSERSARIGAHDPAISAARPTAWSR